MTPGAVRPDTELLRICVLHILVTAAYEMCTFLTGARAVPTCRSTASKPNGLPMR